MTIEDSSLSNSTKVWDQVTIKLGASGSTIRLTTDCPLRPGHICISCKHQGFRDVLNLSHKKSIGAIERHDLCWRQQDLPTC